MMTQVRPCPSCHGTDIVRQGTTPEGKHRYRCRACPERGRPFLLDYASPGHAPHGKHQSGEMALNARGIRATARVGRVRPPTVLKEVKKRNRTCNRGSLQGGSRDSLSRWRGRVVELERWNRGAG